MPPDGTSRRSRRPYLFSKLSFLLHQISIFAPRWYLTQAAPPTETKHFSLDAPRCSHMLPHFSVASRCSQRFSEMLPDPRWCLMFSQDRRCWQTLQHAARCSLMLLESLSCSRCFQTSVEGFSPVSFLHRHAASWSIFASHAEGIQAWPILV